MMLHPSRTNTVLTLWSAMSAIACKSPPPDEHEGKRHAFSESCSWVTFDNLPSHAAFLHSYAYGDSPQLHRNELL
jgi:hypothetical protein